MDFTALTLSDVILLIGTIVIIGAAVRVLLVGFRSWTNVFFSIALFFLAGYVVSNFMIDFVKDPYSSLFWVRISSVSIVLFSASLFIFGRVFDSTLANIEKVKTIALSYFIAFCLTIFSFSSFAIEGVNVNVYPVSLIRGQWYYLIPVALVVFALGTAFNLYSSYKHAYKIEKYQIKYFLAGLITVLAIVLLTNLLLPLWGINDYSRIGPSFIVILALMGGYALTNTNLSDLNFVLLRGSFFTAIVMFYITFLSILYEWLRRVYGSIYNPNSVIIMLFAGFLSLYILNLFKEFEDKVLDTFDRSKRLDIFDKVNQIFVKYTSFGQIQTLIRKNLELGFQAERVELFLSKDENFCNVDSIKAVSFDQLLLKKLRGFQLSSEENNKIFLMQKLKASLVIPLRIQNDLIGNLVFSEKEVSSPYTINEIDFLENLSYTISVGLKKVLLYEEVQNFNLTLQKKIDSATAELQKQKSQLEEKYQFEKDMMGIMGHELRTPMTVAKGMAELLMTKAKGGEAVEKTYMLDKLDKIFSSITKESDLIQTMLSTSHIDNNKINLQLTEVNIVELIDYSLMAFKKDAQAKGLELTFEKPNFEVPSVISDQNRLQEIVTNLISNAIKYTNTGFVRVSLEVQGGYLLFSVKDSGLGIPQSEIQNIGKKFYRIHQHLDDKKDIVRAGGTGLGLYVVKGLLKAMGGELLVESQENVGSTFTAIIPLKIEENENINITQSPTDENDMFAKLGLS